MEIKSTDSRNYHPCQKQQESEAEQGHKASKAHPPPRMPRNGRPDQIPATISTTTEGDPQGRYEAEGEWHDEGDRGHDQHAYEGDFGLSSGVS